MSFEIDQYELDYDEHPPTPTNESHGTPPYAHEYGPTLPLHIVEESAPEDPTEVRTSRLIGPFIPPHLLPSTSASSSNNNGAGFGVERRDDDLSALPSLNSNDFSTSSRGHHLEMPEDENDFNSNVNCSRRDRSDLIGDAFPTPSPPTIGAASSTVVVGPTMPDVGHSGGRQATDSVGPDDGEEEYRGRVIGPSVPSFLEASTSSDAAGPSKVSVGDDEDGVYGPALPPSSPMEPSASGGRYQLSGSASSADEDGDVVGPAMPSSNTDEHDDEYYYRLMQLNEKKTISSAPQREEWMTELPQTLRQSYGLSAKSAFSASSAISPAAADRSRSEWTKTPNGVPVVDTSRKPATMPFEPRPQASHVVASSSSCTTAGGAAASRESLLDTHQRKRKGNGDCGPALKVGERVPFNRDVDMEVHGLSKMTGEEAKNRAGNLVSRFQSSSSSGSQFL